MLLVGTGRQIQDKRKKLAPFGCLFREVDRLTEADLDASAVFVVVGDLPREVAAEASDLCQRRNIPVNVVDRPELCSFFFPALIAEGDLTVSVSTGGKSPAAAAHVCGRIRQQLPDRTGEILDWLGQMRQRLRAEFPDSYRPRLGKLTEAAFRLDRPLTEAEWEALIREEI